MESRERYAERMRMPVAAWLAASVFAVVGAGLVNLGNTDWWRIGAAVAVLAAVPAAAWWFGRLPVRVVERGDEVWLHVDDAKIEMSAVDGVEVLDPVAYADLLGVAQHPLAFVVQRPWIKRGVRVRLDDPSDPTPYWVVSSRNPEGLREALTAGRA